MIRTEMKYLGVFDKFAVSASTVCAVHCLSLPLLLAFFPALGATFFGKESFHVILLWCVIPLSLFSLSFGCLKHKDRFVVALGFVGLALLFFAAFYGHGLLGEVGERVVTLMGATIISGGHLRNYKLCRNVECDD